jgi:hypothetical protein
MFLRWKATWWNLQGSAHTDVLPGLVDGLRSYAIKQEHIYNKLADSFSDKWYPILVSNDIPVGWTRSSELTTPTPTINLDSEDEISNYDDYDSM